MSSADNVFHKLATLLEATADHLSRPSPAVAAPVAAPVAEKQAAETDAHLAEIYETAFGKKAEPGMIAKIANDETLRDTFLKLAERAASPDSLGGPSDRSDEPLAPLTREERAKQAEDRFKNWILTG